MHQQPVVATAGGRMTVTAPPPADRLVQHADDVLAEVAATHDAALAAWVSGPEGPALLGRLTDLLVEGARGRSAVADVLVTFALHRQGQVVDRVRLLLDADGVAPYDGTRSLRADVRSVVVRCTPLTFARLLTGQRSAALELLADRLAVEGDAATVLDAGRVLRCPATAVALVDPGALEPRAVAQALRGVSTAHLRSVIRGPFRDVVLGEVARRLPEHVRPGSAARLRGTAVLRVTGPSGGDAPDVTDRFVVAMADGRVRVTRLTGPDAPPATRRDVTLTCTGEDLRLATGHLHPVTAVLRGRLAVRGDRATALLLSTALDIPRPS
ncbi:SCP2 sterol-binding domain-containing protein [Nocardioides zeae]|uniref:SCP2 sterol-binding domain-containing protein n=1 Tax=Nocardioides zeae TaxID=1457234 RepID=A0A6P0HI24_9ACTN|nr:SCP2 sterol-binding domain-containing protein [Nocardioides zeae]NEN78293.1 SCP2 sterol-binding domain-containing protein [Nocardioides zeae]